MPIRYQQLARVMEARRPIDDRIREAFFNHRVQMGRLIFRSAADDIDNALVAHFVKGKHCAKCGETREVSTHCPDPECSLS